MIQLFRPVQPSPSPFTYAKRNDSGNSFALITQGWAENLFINPVTGISKYIELGMLGHNGIDLIAPHGSPVYASHDGKITKVRNASNVSITQGYGIDITHAEGWRTVYWHFLDTVAIINQDVKRGNLIGYADNTGMSAGDHVHWGFYPANPDYNNGYGGALNPLLYMSIEEILGTANQLNNTNMNYGIDREKNQWLYDYVYKIAFSIPDEPDLENLKKNSQLASLLSKPPAEVDLAGYTLYKGGTEERLKQFFNLK